MIPQLPLGITLSESASLETFVPGENRQLVADIRAAVERRGERFIYLWGLTDSGKSHLLQAACRLASEQALTAAYIPLREAAGFTPAILCDLDHLDLVCLDDLQTIAGQTTWEQALFRLFNQLRDKDSSLLVSADCSPAQLPVALADLDSRLSWGLSYQLHALSDRDKSEALVRYASRRGISLPDATASYILRHTARDMASLLRILDRLDRASLAAQRRLTIPFVRSQLDE
jgi:DnaA family protein